MANGVWRVLRIYTTPSSITIKTREPLEATTKGRVCDGNILLLGNNCLREHVADITMDHNLVDLDLALRMQENPSLIDEYLTLKSKIQDHKSSIEIKHLTQEKINEYGVYKVLELLNIPISCDQDYSSIDITKLTVLNLNKKSIDDSVAECLARLELNALQTLNLSENSIKEIGARGLSSVNLTGLTTLHLEYNQIGDEGARGLSSGNLTSLTTLDLSGNSIGAEGARALSLSKLTSLSTLDLSWNEIGAEGARALSQGNLTSLTTLNISRNGIGDEGARALSQGNLKRLKHII